MCKWKVKGKSGKGKLEACLAMGNEGVLCGVLFRVVAQKTTKTICGLVLGGFQVGLGGFRVGFGLV